MIHVNMYVLWKDLSAGTRKSIVALFVFAFLLPAQPGVGADSVEELSKEKAEKIAQQLREEIRYHDHRYYVLNDPEISDEQYDALKRRLAAIEKAFPDLRAKDSPTQTVGAQPASGLPEVKHPTPMLSLESTTRELEVKTFDVACRKALGVKEIEYLAELKYDGLAVELTYKKGTLVRASTRGDGETGEDVTPNVKTIPDIPEKLTFSSDGFVPPRLTVRGEVYMSKDDFRALNRKRRAAGRHPFATPRNAAAGSLRQKDPAVTGRRRLGAYFYGLADHDQVRCATQRELLEQFVRWGLPVHKLRRQCEDIEAAIKFRDSVAERREQLKLAVDGIVIKINRFDYQRRLGRKRTSPRWAIAFKFPPKKAVTELRGIEFEVGRTGLLTPVAVLEPVEIGGVRVSRANLHSPVVIEKKGLKIGDSVMVRRAGDVIPEIVGPVVSLRDGSEKPFRVPTTCPSCGAKLKRGKYGGLYCTGAECQAQLTERLAHFVSRDCMDIEGFGRRTAEQLVKAGLVKSVADIYGLRTEDLFPLSGFAQKSSGKLLRAIQASRRAPLDRVIYGLGIPEIGEVRAVTLARHFGSLDELLQAETGDIAKLNGIGPTVAANLKDFIGRDANRKTIKKLIDAGVGAGR
ncbi:MAG: NAD-dependent DNA ligase LigA [Planctomycetes bacterium]|nr:NAD-dependent DNA ligase LigA [Planctomycetota bacterium]